ncbi:hypothetical protein BG006_006411 [Podila minutissima]|uniref:Uncharacterized protein n=1 Tax=Podila minutissima TaxID=64525 RepID=A0A9P5SJ15_9FUNG|nr:hypothetical protein BG006_006411 [Podila minutissima]
MSEVALIQMHGPTLHSGELQIGGTGVSYKDMEKLVHHLQKPTTIRIEGIGRRLILLAYMSAAITLQLTFDEVLQLQGKHVSCTRSSTGNSPLITAIKVNMPFRTSPTDLTKAKMRTKHQLLHAQDPLPLKEYQQKGGQTEGQLEEAISSLLDDTLDVTHAHNRMSTHSNKSCEVTDHTKHSTDMIVMKENFYTVIQSALASKHAAKLAQIKQKNQELESSHAATLAKIEEDAQERESRNAIELAKMQKNNQAIKSRFFVALAKIEEKNHELESRHAATLAKIEHEVQEKEIRQAAELTKIMAKNQKLESDHQATLSQIEEKNRERESEHAAEVDRIKQENLQFKQQFHELCLELDQLHRDVNTLQLENTQQAMASHIPEGAHHSRAEHPAETENNLHRRHSVTEEPDHHVPHQENFKDSLHGQDLDNEPFLEDSTDDLKPLELPQPAQTPPKSDGGDTNTPKTRNWKEIIWQWDKRLKEEKRHFDELDQKKPGGQVEANTSSNARVHTVTNVKEREIDELSQGDIDEETDKDSKGSDMGRQCIPRIKHQKQAILQLDSGDPKKGLTVPLSKRTFSKQRLHRDMFHPHRTTTKEFECFGRNEGKMCNVYGAIRRRDKELKKGCDDEMGLEDDEDNKDGREDDEDDEEDNGDDEEDDGDDEEDGDDDEEDSGDDKEDEEEEEERLVKKRKVSSAAGHSSSFKIKAIPTRVQPPRSSKVVL